MTRTDFARLVVAILASAVEVASAETVQVKYRGLVDLAPFECDDVSRSSLVTRLCYDARNKYVVVGLQGVYYHYCIVPASTVAAWRAAPSMGRFFNQSIKGNFGCRPSGVPS